jgi:Ca-activated chloride channel family protein
MSDFHLLRPLWLLALPPLALLIGWMARAAREGGDWSRYCDPALLPHILVGAPSRQSRRPLRLAGLASALAVLALAGPAWQRLPAPVFRNLSAVVILMDLSSAMEATDVKPNRLDRARFKIDDLLRARQEGQTALVAYAGDAFVVTPLTDDVATIQAQLTALSPRIMPEPGARMDLGLAAAGRLLQQARQRVGDILVVTAGETNAAVGVEVSRLKSMGYRVSVLGVGSRDGAPVPLPDGGFLKNDEGRMVVSRLDIQALWQLAQTGGGVYRTLDAGAADTGALLEYLDRRSRAEQREGEAQSVHVDRWRDEGVWLLPPLLPLAALAFRRGWLGLWLLVLLLPAPGPAEAFEWRDLWLTPDQQARRNLEAGDAKAAARRFEDPAWKAAAAYRAGEYDAAAQQLESLKDSPAHYNRGNALARQGRLEDALKAYDQALRQTPGEEDTLYNRKLVEDALKKRQEQQEKPEDSQDGGQGSEQQQPQDQKENSEKSRDRNPSGDKAQDQAGKDEEKQAQSNETGQAPQTKDEPHDQQSPGAENASQPDEKQEDQDSRSGEKQRREQAAEPSESPGPESPPGEGDRAAAADSVESISRDENEQAEAQWLRRIPDDPGGLLKRKFYYQYRLRQQQKNSE